MGKVPWPTGLRSAWISFAWDNPTAYLAHRADVMRWLVWPPDIYKCMPAWVGVEGPPELLAKLGLTPQQRPADLALYAQVQALAQTPLFRHGYYLLAASCFLWYLEPPNGPPCHNHAASCKRDRLRSEFRLDRCFL